MSSLKQTVSCLRPYNGDKQAINAAELGRRERFRLFASSRPRRVKSVKSVKSYMEGGKCVSDRDRERRDGSQTRNFASLASVTLGKIVKPQKKKSMT